MDSHETWSQLLHRLKVFPLPSAVLLPGAALPLHIFEPRYREMVKDALATDRVFAMGQLEPGWEGDYQGRPQLSPIAVVGRVVWEQQLEAGKYDLVVHGLARVRLVEELPPRRLYREVRAQLIEDPEYRGPEEDLLRQSVYELGSRIPGAPLTRWMPQLAQAQGGALADMFAAVLVEEVEVQRRVLNELDPQRRLQLALDWISDRLARIAPRPASNQLH